MTRNVELLEAVMRQIIDHPELHDQGWWLTPRECGTAGCFAGWAWMLSGREPVQSILDYAHGGIHPPPEGVSHDLETFKIEMTRLLGLSESEASTLFCATNTREALQLMVKDLVNGDVLRDADDYEL